MPARTQRGVATGRRLQCQEFTGNLDDRVLGGRDAQEGDSREQRGQEHDTPGRFDKDAGSDPVCQRQKGNREGKEKQYPSDAGDIARCNNEIESEERHGCNGRNAGGENALHDGCAETNQQT